MKQIEKMNRDNEATYEKWPKKMYCDKYSFVKKVKMCVLMGELSHI